MCLILARIVQFYYPFCSLIAFQFILSRHYFFQLSYKILTKSRLNVTFRTSFWERIKYNTVAALRLLSSNAFYHRIRITLHRYCSIFRNTRCKNCEINSINEWLVVTDEIHVALSTYMPHHEENFNIYCNLSINEHCTFRVL